MDFDVVIGLEVHCQLSTKSKIFAPDSNKFGDEANKNISVITLGHPGTLPFLNKEAVNAAIKAGLAFDCEINQYNYFDRKNYFYPDLPKGYQISQDKAPICKGGQIRFKIKKGKDFEDHSVKIHHIHMEEDAGKSIHDINPQCTLLDYNRAGTPLLEIVSEPCINSPEQAGAYLSEIRKIVRYLGISDGNMEQGSLRADLNISLKPKGSTTLGIKVEIKNMNSIRYLVKAAEYEIERQSKLLQDKKVIVQETRGFDADKGITFSQRVKETMNDYRYFPEPDLAPIHITDEELQKIKHQIPVLPLELFDKYQKEFYLLPEYAYQLSEDIDFSKYFEEMIKHGAKPKPAASWLLSNVKGLINDKGITLKGLGIKAEKLSELLKYIEEGFISSSAGNSLMQILTEQPEQNLMILIQSNGLTAQKDQSILSTWIDEILDKNPEKVKEYKKGKKGLMGMFVGEVMKLSKGSADPKILNQLIAEKLNTL